MFSRAFQFSVRFIKAGLQPRPYFFPIPALSAWRRFYWGRHKYLFVELEHKYQLFFGSTDLKINVYFAYFFHTFWNIHQHGGTSYKFITSIGFLTKFYTNIKIIVSRNDLENLKFYIKGVVAQKFTTWNSPNIAYTASSATWWFNTLNTNNTGQQQRSFFITKRIFS